MRYPRVGAAGLAWLGSGTCVEVAPGHAIVEVRDRCRYSEAVGMGMCVQNAAAGDDVLPKTPGLLLLNAESR